MIRSVGSRRSCRSRNDKPHRIRLQRDIPKRFSDPTRPAAVGVGAAQVVPRSLGANHRGPGSRVRETACGGRYTGPCKAQMGRVPTYAAMSDPGTVRARGCARREDHPGAAGRTARPGPTRPGSKPKERAAARAVKEGGTAGRLAVSSLRRSQSTHPPEVDAPHVAHLQPRSAAGRPACPGAPDPLLLAGPEDLPAQPGAVRGPPRVGVLRGPAHRERHARRAPHRGPRLQGRLPALPHHEGLPRGPQGRLGLPRPAGGARGGEGAGLLREAGHREVRHRRVQRQVPRVGDPAHRRVRRADRADGLLGRPRPGLPHHGPLVHRVGVVVAPADLRQGPAGPGPPGRPVVPALRHRPVRPRAGPGLRDRGRPLGVRALPAHLRPAGRERRPAGVDHHAVDPGLQHRRRRPPGGDLRGRHRRQRAPGRRRAAGRQGARRGLGDHRRVLHRRRDGALALPAPVRAGRDPGRPLRADGRVRHHRGRHRHRPPVARVRRRRPRDLPPLRPARGQPGGERRHLRRRRAAGRRGVLQEGRRDPGRRPEGP